jgi:DNA-binding FrmR family transcriptional regulator
MTTKEAHQRALVARLRRVEGQLRGIQGMIEKDASCEAIAQQLSAARRALDRSFFEMLACSMEFEIEQAPSTTAAKKAGAQIGKLLAKYG